MDTPKSIIKLRPEDPLSPPPSATFGSTLYSLVAQNAASVETPPERNPPKPKICFSDVSVYYFPRTQGWVSVPREGGTTIGMTDKHFHSETRKISVSEDPSPLDETDDPHVKRKLFGGGVCRQAVMDVCEADMNNVGNNSHRMFDRQDTDVSFSVGGKDAVQPCTMYDRQDTEVSFAMADDVARSLVSFPVPGEILHICIVVKS